MIDKKVELLAPAGDYDCFVQAMKNGADAVYLAGQRFGARAYAGNFEKDEILRALDYVHINNKKIYLTVNTVFKQKETEQLYDFIRPFYENGLDGVIVQDIGALQLLNKCFPRLELHASTQMSICNAAGVRFLQDLGVSRVVPARELSLKEIESIISETGIEVESFIHGAMCYAYSGKCLFSSFLGGRSGNRGRCAQPCRLVYNNVYPLSMKDMYTLPMVPELISSGIASFKIEGRMKSKEYVACVTGIYRKYIDMYYDNPQKYSVMKCDEDIILGSYTRSGNCSGYYKQYNGKNMITVTEPCYNGKKVSADEIKLFTDKSDLKMPIKAYMHASIGEPVSLTLECGDTFVTIYGENVERANANPTDGKLIEKQLSKTGGTSFEMIECNVSGDADIFIPVGKLNELRRNGIETLKQELLKPYRRSDSIDYKSSYGCNEQAHDAAISASCQSVPAFYRLLENDKLSEIIVPASLLIKEIGFDGAKCSNIALMNKLDSMTLNERRLLLSLPEVVRDTTKSIVIDAINLSGILNISGILVANLESLQMLNDSGYKGEIIADEHMYCTNSESIDVLKNRGVSQITYPIELNRKELLELNQSGEYLIVYGKTPLMVSAGCVRKTLSGCEHKEGFYYLTDRKKAVFTVLTRCNECTNIIYNSVPLYISYDADIINGLKPGKLRIDFTDESIGDIDCVLNHYIEGRSLDIKKFTRGHINKGVE